MKRTEICSTDGIVYSFIDGGYHKEFDYRGNNYVASLLPNAMAGSHCTVLKIDDKDDVNNITASEDTRRVYFRRFNNFKEENLRQTVKEFLDFL